MRVWLEGSWCLCKIRPGSRVHRAFQPYSWAGAASTEATRGKDPVWAAKVAAAAAPDTGHTPATANTLATLWL